MDSFRSEIKAAINGKPVINRLYYFYLKINQYGIVAFNKGTITQLKNSGSLRLINNDLLLTEILDYYERRVVGSEIYQQSTQKAFDSYAKNAMNIFSTKAFDYIATVSDSSLKDQMDESYKKGIQEVLNSNSLKLLTNDSRELEKLHSEVLDFEWSLINYNRFLNYTRDGANKLMADIRERY